MNTSTASHRPHPRWLRIRQCRASTSATRREPGYTLVEILLALTLAALLLTAVGAGLRGALGAWDLARERNHLTRQARFAMNRMRSAVRAAPQLILPLAENPATPYSEAIRSVLAVVLDPVLDRDEDGFADADNDRDGQVDEDLPADTTNDNAAGLFGIDDDGDGNVDEGSSQDDDEDGASDEDDLDDIDDDGDRAIDEDPGNDGSDDDGDGLFDEDWFDTVVYFVSGTTLVERMPDLDPTDGRAFQEYVIADNVVRFRVERLDPAPGDRAVLVEIALDLESPLGERISLVSRVRTGGLR